MLTWLADVLRADGLRVLELADWKRRGRPDIDPQGVVCHHTASSPNTPNSQVRALLRDGRPDLKGPLSQLGLERDGTFVVVAAGRCSHNGFGTWGNDSIGVEAYNDGVGEPWPEAQLDAYVRGVAALCRRMGWGPDRVKGHKETDPRRKIDPTFDMDLFRARVFPRGDDLNADQDARLTRIERLVEEAVIDTRLIEPRSKETTLGVRVLLGRKSGVDTATLAASVADLLDDDLARAVADELARRLEG